MIKYRLTKDSEWIATTDLPQLQPEIEISTEGSLDLSSLTTLPEGVTISAGEYLFLNSLTTLPEGITLTAGWSIYLNSLTTLPEGITLTAGWSIYLDSLTTLPEGVSLTAGRVPLPRQPDDSAQGRLADCRGGPLPQQSDDDIRGRHDIGRGGPLPQQPDDAVRGRHADSRGDSPAQDRPLSPAPPPVARGDGRLRRRIRGAVPASRRLVPMAAPRRGSGTSHRAVENSRRVCRDAKAQGRASVAVPQHEAPRKRCGYYESCKRDDQQRKHMRNLNEIPPNQRQRMDRNNRSPAAPT